MIKTYKVIVKEVYTYHRVPAESKSEAIQKVIDLDWRYHDETDQPLEYIATRETKHD